MNLICILSFKIKTFDIDLKFKIKNFVLELAELIDSGKLFYLGALCFIMNLCVQALCMRGLTN